MNSEFAPIVLKKSKIFNMKNTELIIRERLFAMQDTEYKDFHSRLMPTIDPETIIGVRVPMLRKFAKELSRNGETAEFMKTLPHKYYEENNLHAFLIEQINDFDIALAEVEKFLPYVDNWATCDSMSPKVFRKHPNELLTKIKMWISSDKTYTVRFGLGMLMKFYLDDNFKEEYLAIAASVKSDEYYVNMMISWFFATALAKQYDTALPYIKERRLTAWVHNKTIQKSIESYRISNEQKAFLRTMKIK